MEKTIKFRKKAQIVNLISMMLSKKRIPELPQLFF